METILKLSEKDIKKIIAKECNVDVDSVMLKVESRCCGYGEGEHEAHIVSAQVTHRWEKYGEWFVRK